jgi:hypothetical protein
VVLSMNNSSLFSSWDFVNCIADVSLVLFLFFSLLLLLLSFFLSSSSFLFYF